MPETTKAVSPAFSPDTPSTKRQPETASQTAGPYVHIGLVPAAAGFDIYDQSLGEDIAGPHAAGQRIRVQGQVFDGDDALVRDALIEFWQPNHAGHYADCNTPTQEPGFRGWGRAVSDFETGLWHVDTVKPGQVARPDGQIFAPQIHLWLVARGINLGLHTRLFFDDEPEANAADPVLNTIGHPLHRQTLIAARTDDPDHFTYHFDIHLQGEAETVFFDI